MEVILAIDPGDAESAYVFWDGKNILDKGKVDNNELSLLIKEYDVDQLHLVIEMVASYGMPVGKTVFETCVWIGRFMEQRLNQHNITRVYRTDIKNHICHATKAKDSNVIQALVDRFGNTHEHGKYSKGTKKNPGFFYEFSKDIWQAFAVAVYYYDIKQ